MSDNGDTETPLVVDRRSFLQLAAALGILPPWLAACGSGEDALGIDGAPVELWRKAREALRASPDHLAAQAADAVASGNAETILGFVRDSIVTRPWAVDTHRLQVDRTGYVGARGVLRSGFGTPREKAELLKQLYEDAGFEAEIVDGDIDYDELGGWRLLHRAGLPAFAPDEELAPVEAWTETLGLNASKIVDVAPRSATENGAVAARLLEAFPPDRRVDEPDWSSLVDWLPLVRVTVDGEARYANPHVANAVLGEHYCNREPIASSLQTPVPTPTLRLTLSMSTLRDPYSSEDVLTGEWAMEDIVGRRLRLRFLPTEDAETLLAMPIGQIRTFMPAFTVEGAGVVADDADRLGYAADPITTSGDRVSISGDRILVNDRERRLVAGDAALADSVSELSLSINASEFPRLRIEANVLDAAGETISGLPALSFRALHGGAPLTLDLLRNAPEPPRVLFAIDFSSSLRDDFETVRTAPLVARVAEAVSAQYPDAEFRAGKFSGGMVGSAIEYFGDWTADGQTVATSVATAVVDGIEASSYWPALAEAVHSDATIVVLITDGDGTHGGTPEQRALISEGCPAVIIGVDSVRTVPGEFEALAELSGGHLHMATDIGAAANAAAAVIEHDASHTYVFDCEVDADVGEHTVDLFVDAASVAASSAYDASAKVATARSICGLFLTVELGDRKATRRLAGFAPLRHTEHAPVEADLLDAKLALLTRYDLSVEGAAPTASAALDDLLDSFIDSEGLGEALKAGDPESLLSANSYSPPPSKWFALNSPLPGRFADDAMTFQTGYRMILHRDGPNLDGLFETRSDILPFGDWRTIAPPGVDSFARTVETTLGLTLLEAANFETNTIERLGETRFDAARQFELTNWARRIEDPVATLDWQLAAADRAGGRLPHELLLPRDTSRRAYWEIDPRGGTVLGLLMDASGHGSAADAARTFAMLAQVISIYAELVNTFMSVSPAFGVWVELEKAKLAQLRRATIAIILMDGSVMGDPGELLAEEVEDYIRGEAEGRIRGAIESVVPGAAEAGRISDWIDHIRGLFGAYASEES